MHIRKEELIERAGGEIPEGFTDCSVAERKKRFLSCSIHLLK